MECPQPRATGATVLCDPGEVWARPTRDLKTELSHFANSTVPFAANEAEGRATLALPSTSCFEINPAKQTSNYFLVAIRASASMFSSLVCGWPRGGMYRVEIEMNSALGRSRKTTRSISGRLVGNSGA
jgi:hypothetical protein